MASDSDSLAERVSTSIQQLALVAVDLNSASDELGKAISAIDTVLSSLSLGVATWVTIHGGSDDRDQSYWSRELGYAKVSNKWGISLRTREGDYNFPDDDQCDSWLFNDAPRWLRVEGVEKIPALLEALIKSTQETTKKIKEKTVQAKEFSTAIAQAAKKKSESPSSPVYSKLDPFPPNVTFGIAPPPSFGKQVPTSVSPSPVRIPNPAATKTKGGK